MTDSTSLSALETKAREAIHQRVRDGQWAPGGIGTEGVLDALVSAVEARARAEMTEAQVPLFDAVKVYEAMYPAYFGSDQRNYVVPEFARNRGSLHDAMRAVLDELAALNRPTDVHLGGQA